eukprot:CAMPEP_0172177284 /NCGR_PEP_ID=MMETSP1050-20130122/15346_1 /TAXON_ID=233186 /ORGANISM="Cryptomonas curvata, Strain CCAP979/52" /LENGTH=123 /DNA_ID=CAMNT_0012849777 /DNA_START=810 /DNA_END=1178 /DNA_ORIENTATION=+
MPNGGGDTPEAVTAAMYEASCLDWRDDAAKLVVFMADAGPHGLGEGGSSRGPIKRDIPPQLSKAHPLMQTTGIDQCEHRAPHAPQARRAHSETPTPTRPGARPRSAVDPVLEADSRDRRRRRD